MDADKIVREIASYCQKTGLAESTFGRLAINDGKLVARLRDGGRITTTTLDRLRAFMAENPPGRTQKGVVMAPRRNGRIAAPLAAPVSDPQRNFRFFDNRQKYLLFVNT